MSLFCRVIQTDDLQDILDLENKKLQEAFPDEMERMMAGWNSKFRVEALNHHIGLGWSFLARDEENKLMILSLIRTLAKTENKLILFSSHDWRLAKEFSDKIWWLKDGKLISGISEEVILKNTELIQPKILQFNKNFHPPSIDAPKIEKEMMFSFLQKNFASDLTNFKLTFKNDKWELNLDDFYDNCHSLSEVKRSLQNLIDKGTYN